MRVIRMCPALVLLTVGVGSLIIGGCRQVRPTLHESFGASVASAWQAQAANPRASENLSPVAQMNGRAANQAVETYAKSFEPEAKHDVNASTMFVGLGAAGGTE